MQKQFSIFALSNTGSSVKRITVSGISIFFISFFVAAGLISFGFICYDYVAAKKIAVNSSKLEKQIFSQQDELSNQRKHIQNFVHKIEELKTKLASLQKFEKKIRIIANIEKTDSKNDFFGVGGSAPEILKPGVTITKKHNSLIREMHAQLSQIDNIAETQKNNFETLVKKLKIQQNLLASTPTIRPITKGWISSGFGYRRSPFTGRKEFHKGIDFATRQGNPIFATADGVIIYAKPKGLLGKTVIINHGHGLKTRYGHTSKILKKKGAKVKRGDIIALVGNTGRSTGPHVHYEVQLNGIQVNPGKYILD